MQRLREVEGDADKIKEQVVKLNGKPSSQEEIDKLREDKSKRVVEQNPGDYKVLEHLRG